MGLKPSSLEGSFKDASRRLQVLLIVVGLDMCKICPQYTFRSTLNTGYITGLDMCKVYHKHTFRSTLNTGYITGLDMCKVCT